jgi:hypothetical protein
VPQPRNHQHIGLAHPVLQGLEITNGTAIDAGIEGRKPLMQLIGDMGEADRELLVGWKHSRSPFERSGLGGRTHVFPYQSLQPGSK